MANEVNITRFFLFKKQFSNAYDHIFNAAVSECDVTRPEADVLIFLENNPQYDTAKDVALYRGFSKSYVSKAVELLLNKKLIFIKTDKDDRRYQHLYITNKAKPIVEKLLLAQKQFLLVIMDGISEEEKACCEVVLQKIMRNVGKASEKS